MKALITGASSGIGREMAIYLSKLGYDVILVSRDKEKLKKVSEELNTNFKIITKDLANIKDVYSLYNEVKDEKIDILINNAGFGLFGLFTDTDLDREIEMINLNVISYHILTKLFLQDFAKRNEGYILNVCSSAGFMAGPRLNTYYATKNYVTKLTMAINEELRQSKSSVHISALCPGPVDTNFNKVAKGNFGVKGLDASFVAKYAIDKMFKNKMIIVPGLTMKLALFGARFLPYRVQLKMVYNIQKKKTNSKV
jgi:hypothetical protein